jgi:5-methylcytosine-specific restriction endonuclease McrA
MTKRMSSRTRKHRYEALLRRDGDTCFWCEVGLTSATRTLDHLVPLSKGGSNRLDNLVLSCEPCNAERGGVHGATSACPGRPSVPSPAALERMRSMA